MQVPWGPGLSFLSRVASGGVAGWRVPEAWPSRGPPASLPALALHGQGAPSPAPPPQGLAGKGAWASSSRTAHAPWSRGHAVNVPPQPRLLAATQLDPRDLQGLFQEAVASVSRISASGECPPGPPGPQPAIRGCVDTGVGWGGLCPWPLPSPAAQAGSRDGAEAGQRPVSPHPGASHGTAPAAGAPRPAGLCDLDESWEAVPQSRPQAGPLVTGLGVGVRVTSPRRLQTWDTCVRGVGL